MRYFILLIILLFSCIFVNFVYSAVGPRLIVNDELKECRIIGDSNYDTALPNGWKYFKSVSVDVYETEGGYKKDYSEAEELCNSLGYYLETEKIFWPKIFIDLWRPIFYTCLFIFLIIFIIIVFFKTFIIKRLKNKGNKKRIIFSIFLLFLIILLLIISPLIISFLVVDITMFLL